MMNTPFRTPAVIALIAAPCAALAGQPPETLNERFTLLNPAAAEQDRFGSAVDIDAGRVVVGGSGLAGASQVDPVRGAVMYNASNGSVLGTFSSGIGGDSFGAAMDLFDQLLIVGAPGDDAAGADAGAAYIFDAVTGAMLSRIAPPQLDARDNFGAAVATNGEVLLIAAPHDNENGTNAGRVYFYDIADPENPIQITRFQHARAEEHDNFGASIAINGNLAAIGAPNAESSGEVYLFNINPANPDSPRYMSTMPRPEGTASRFGQSVAYSGIHVLVGTHNNGDDRGEAHLFRVQFATNPFFVTSFQPDAGGEVFDFGYQVALDGDRAVIGAADDVASGSASGAAFVFDLSDPDMPTQTHTLRSADPAPNDSMGSAVAVSGNTVVVGAPGADAGQTGAAYLFDLTPPCSQADFVTPYGSLDLNDITAFIAAFVGESPEADLDGNELFDAADLTLFITAFTAGCAS